jgi:hypothetical protein
VSQVQLSTLHAALWQLLQVLPLQPLLQQLLQVLLLLPLPTYLQVLPRRRYIVRHHQMSTRQVQLNTLRAAL